MNHGAGAHRTSEGTGVERRLPAWSLVFLSALLLTPGAAAAVWHALREATVSVREAVVSQPRRTNPDDTLASAHEDAELDPTAFPSVPEVFAQIAVLPQTPNRPPQAAPYLVFTCRPTTAPPMLLRRALRCDAGRAPPVA